MPWDFLSSSCLKWFASRFLSTRLFANHLPSPSPCVSAGSFLHTQCLHAVLREISSRCPQSQGKFSDMNTMLLWNIWSQPFWGAMLGPSLLLGRRCPSTWLYVGSEIPEDHRAGNSRLFLRCRGEVSRWRRCSSLNNSSL